MEPMPRLFTKGFQALSLPLEWILLKRAKLGEKEAFGKLYEMYLDRIYRFIFFKVRQDRLLAEDLTAEVFVKAWLHLSSFKKGSFQAWLYTIARNRVIDHIRTAHQHVELDDSLADQKESVEDTVIRALTAEQIMEGLQELSEEQREIIILRFVQDLSYKEIATITQKKEEAIRALQYRALKQLRKNI